MPGIWERKQIWELNLKYNQHVILQRDFWFLAKKTEGYSGADIQEIVHESQSLALRRSFKANYFIKVGRFYAPCTKRDKGAIKLSHQQMTLKNIELPPIDMRDIEVAMSYVKAKNSGEDDAKYEEHIKTYGR